MMSEYATPVILLAWKDDALKEEVERLGGEVLPLLAFERGKKFEHIRSRVDYLHRLLSQSPSTKIDYRRKQVFSSWPTRFERFLYCRYRELEYFLKGDFTPYLLEYEHQFWKDTNAQQYRDVFKTYKVDAVLSLTPIRVEEEPILRIAKAEGVRTMAAVFSFDSSITRGLVRATRIPGNRSALPLNVRVTY